MKKEILLIPWNEYCLDWIFDTILFFHPGLQNHKQNNQAKKVVIEFTLTFSLQLSTTHTEPW